MTLTAQQPWVAQLEPWPLTCQQPGQPFLLTLAVTPVPILVIARPVGCPLLSALSRGPSALPGAGWPVRHTPRAPSCTPPEVRAGPLGIPTSGGTELRRRRGGDAEGEEPAPRAEGNDRQTEEVVPPRTVTRGDGVPSVSGGLASRNSRTGAGISVPTAAASGSAQRQRLSRPRGNREVSEGRLGPGSRSHLCWFFLPSLVAQASGW